MPDMCLNFMIYFNFNHCLGLLHHVDALSNTFLICITHVDMCFFPFNIYIRLYNLYKKLK